MAAPATSYTLRCMVRRRLMVAASRRAPGAGLSTRYLSDPWSTVLSSVSGFSFTDLYALSGILWRQNTAMACTTSQFYRRCALG